MDYKVGDRVYVKYKYAYSGVWQKGSIIELLEDGTFEVLLDIDRDGRDSDNVHLEGLILVSIYESPLYKVMQEDG